MSMGIDEDSLFATVGEENKESQCLYDLGDSAFIEFIENMVTFAVSQFHPVNFTVSRNLFMSMNVNNTRNGTLWGPCPDVAFTSE